MFIDRFRLDGKVALLTGAARGIGHGIARVLAEQGCAVAIQDIDEAVARETAQSIAAETGVRAIALGGDIADIAAVEQLVPRTIEQLGGLHILVNNAGIQADKHYREQSVNEIERQFRANLTAAMRLIQIAAPILQGQKWGRVLNIGSIQGRRGNTNNLPYGMTKSALAHMTQSLARELTRDGVTINCIAPGWFDTLRNAKFITQQNREEAKRAIPVGRHGNDFDCAGFALLLCSDAGLYITGQTITVDGGLTA
jgi:NAD(P)-dependent dehydrogenase (short-subunit alcohol dehydrogenase family)